MSALALAQTGVRDMPPKTKAKVAGKTAGTNCRTRTNFPLPGLTRKPAPAGQKLLPGPKKPGSHVEKKVTPPKRLPKAPPKVKGSPLVAVLGVPGPPPPKTLPKARPKLLPTSKGCPNRSTRSRSRSPIQDRPAPIAAAVARQVEGSI